MIHEMNYISSVSVQIVLCILNGVLVLHPYRLVLGVVELWSVPMCSVYFTNPIKVGFKNITENTLYIVIRRVLQYYRI